jgi:hypothetical protein
MVPGAIDVVKWIRQLDEQQAVTLARALIRAEAGIANLPLDSYSMSGRTKVGDEGVDGRTNFPPSDRLLLPTGPQVWQVKSGSSERSALQEFDKKHKALIESINGGDDYLLFWTDDPVDPKATRIKAAFEAEVKAIRADASCVVLFADRIERLCLRHLGVLAQLSDLPLQGVMGIPLWHTMDELAAIPFQPDDQRAQSIALLQAHTRSVDTNSTAVHVYGDTGVGKSRLVYEALREPGIAERVLVAPDVDHLDKDLLVQVGQDRDRHLILVVDDCTQSDRDSLTRYVGMAEGRVRLITIGGRSRRDLDVPDDRYIPLTPLLGEACKQVALGLGLNESDADRVAGLTEGYPGLARTLAEAIAHDSSDTPLMQRVRGHQRLGPILEALLPPDDIAPLSVLALFERIGYDGEFSQELTIACEQFNVSETTLRRICDRELGRFVSRAGRFRRVSPRLFAVWLVGEFFDRYEGNVATTLAALPSSLRDRIVEQMQDAAGDPRVEAAFVDILSSPPFSSGTLAEVDGGAARLLHVAAITAPAAAMDVIDRLINRATVDDLRQFGPGRRETVWALEVLLWFEDLFEPAADALLRLAVAENETWANNATGTLKGAFKVFLGGTSAPYSRRLAWASRILDAPFARAAISIIVDGLGHGLAMHESRSVTHFGGRSSPAEWRPALVADEVSARRGAWEQLVQVARELPEERDHVADIMAKGLGVALRMGLKDLVLPDIRSIQWSPNARTAFGSAVSFLLRVPDTPPDIREELGQLRDQLEGSTEKDKLDYLLTLPSWQLSRPPTSSYQPGGENLLAEVAQELVSEGADAILAAVDRASAADPQSAGLLFQQIASTSNDESLLPQLEGRVLIGESVILGYFAGLADRRGPEWAKSVIRRWLENQDLGHLVIRAIHLLPADDELANLAVRAVDRGSSDADELGRLLYGAWTRPLSSTAVMPILQKLESAGTVAAVEQGLGIAQQWFEEHPEDIDDDLNATAKALVESSKGMAEDAGMVRSLRADILGRLNLSATEKIEILLPLLSAENSYIEEQELGLFESLAKQAPADAVRATVRLLTAGGQDGSAWNPFLSHSRLLSRLEHFTSSELVVATVQELVERSIWPSLVEHIDATPDTPDPLLLALLAEDGSDELRDKATFAFMFPGATMGSLSRHFAGRIEVAKRWQGEVTTPMITTWLDEILIVLREHYEAAVAQDEERGW